MYDTHNYMYGDHTKNAIVCSLRFRRQPHNYIIYVQRTKTLNYNILNYLNTVLFFLYNTHYICSRLNSKINYK